MGRKRDDSYYNPPEPRTEPVLPQREVPADIPSFTEIEDDSARKSERINWICNVMRENRWPVWPASLMFRQVLAQTWGVAEATIRGYSAEAHRIIEIDPLDRAQLAQDVAREMDAIKLDALATINHQTGLPDYGSAIKALELKAKYLGAEPPKEVKLSGGVSLASIDELRKALDDDGKDGSG